MLDVGKIDMQLSWQMPFFLFLISTIIFVQGCANPINRVTSDRYMAQCHEAAQNEQLVIAEEACYRSLVNVDMGNLGPELKSHRLYKLGEIKRRIGKYEEAVPLFQMSLEIEEKLSGPSSPKIAGRLAELALSHLENSRMSDGIPLVQRLGTMTNHLSGFDRKLAGATFHYYAEELKKREKHELATEFSKKQIRSDLYLRGPNQW